MLLDLKQRKRICNQNWNVMERRDFVKESSLLLGGLGAFGSIHPAILKAMNIKPEEGSTFYDAEHVVVLMQENRSFDHCFGSLRGVRGFRDKHTFRKPDGKSVFFQRDGKKTYAPFNLDIKNTKASWMDSLPHDWDNQQYALNKGKFDNWLPAKTSGIDQYKDIPLTLGYYNREDLPFYYQLADAFTVFDQYFCSSLTGTTPNRLYHWSGTLRPENKGDVHPNVVNWTVGYDKNVHWKTFPELLEEEDISWRIYQNELSLEKGMKGEQEPYLANFTNNPLEWFSQYKVKFSPKYYEHAKKKAKELEHKLRQSPENREEFEEALKNYKSDVENYDPKEWEKLSAFEKHIHEKAFTINKNDPHYWDLEEIDPADGEKMYIPKGDILHQFRKDVENKELPTVSWLIAPERFSDHPTSPWYGAWYISEVLNILTQNPDIWKKTIFILNYDENDGYFDHVVPFFAPDNSVQKPDLHGAPGVDYVDSRQKYYNKEKLDDAETVEGPIGLGYRVPMIIASPWTTGGYVNSEVTDHTSVIQFLEKFLNTKRNKQLHTDAISDWRRAVCGDLTSAFRQDREKHKQLRHLHQKSFVEGINAAKEKPVPNNYVALSEEEQSRKSQFFPIQESGLRPANPLDYRFEVNLGNSGILMENKAEKAVPLNVYNRLKLTEDSDFLLPYTLYIKKTKKQKIALEGEYDWEVFGPNGFYRNFKGETTPEIKVYLQSLDNGDVELRCKGYSSSDTLEIQNHYTRKTKETALSEASNYCVKASEFSGWYDLDVRHGSNVWSFAGRAEHGEVSCSDPHWI